MINHWDAVHLRQALSWAKESKDPSTRVGCVIAGPDHETRSTGFNGFPRGIEDRPDRLLNRETKLQYTVHAEQNAILAAARVGIPLLGCTLYIVGRDTKTGELSGGHPCGSKCTPCIIQAGIARIVSFQQKGFSKWAEELALGEAMSSEAGITFEMIHSDDVV